MSDRTYRLDMRMMVAVHNAFRRDLERIARITARTDDDPRRVLRTAAGWEMFKTYLRVHHTSEDDALWPVMRQALADRPDGLALLEAMEAEHAAIDPLLNAVDTALTDRDHGPERLGDLTDALAVTLGEHLGHEESEGLPLIDATLTEQQWQHFGAVHRDRIGTAAPRYLPWVLDDANEEAAAAILARLPESIRTAYRDEWRSAYAGLDLWSAGNEPATA
ncbi:Hemerythrin HHE cation binding domain-containing protein [Thermomonospora echinospora]|uniref:Hemerythrin HHE cation binding domain-containing protein n=1 Tax=Thermomonospora echinospora TaxID=1992 RepID=A0A1H6CV95_9ACTN|nr:hemerythrin domain-containing protein [Thermomonospora echinospora]SEG76326.1 Hemerythrin HHE cation binding domain-containing protein [Thermomonospora echinospora]